MKKKNYKKIILFEEKILNTLSRIFLSSFLMISFFYITPMFIKFAERNLNTQEFTNNSKKHCAMNKIKIIISGILVSSILSLSGCYVTKAGNYVSEKSKAAWSGTKSFFGADEE